MIVIPVNLSQPILGEDGEMFETPMSVQAYIAEKDLGDFWIQKNAYGQPILCSTLEEGQDFYLTYGPVADPKDAYASIVIGGHPIKERPHAI